MFKSFLRNKLLRTGAYYGAASMYKSAAVMVAGIVLIKWLDPEQIGLWQSLTVIKAYIPFFEFGVNSGLNRELPFSYGKGDHDHGHKLASSALGYSFLLSIIILFSTFVITAILFILNRDIKIVASVLVLGVIIAMETYQRYLVVTYRSENAFNKLALVYLVDATLVMLLMIFIYFFHYKGLLIYSFLASLELTFLMNLVRPVKVLPKLNFKILKSLSTVGFPIYIMGYLKGVSNSFIRLVLLKFGGVRIVGLYSPASAVASVMALFPTVFANFFYPQMTYRYGQTGDPKTLWPAVWKTYLIIAAMSAPIVVVIWFSSPYLIATYFPKYIQSVPAMQILALSYFFSGSVITHNVLYSVKALKIAGMFTLTQLICYAVIPLLMVKFGSVILKDVAYAVLIIESSLALLNFLLIRKVLFNKNYQISKSDEK